MTSMTTGTITATTSAISATLRTCEMHDRFA